ncbi:TonB-dependent receptor plug domain-containing protein [Olivibacter sp. SDN3]|uniref:TonB-dependent receptor plug domain-containing protein n=1 Tax=Olivibacter sp. SDN3 TaxID=2764720 RepID=UPI0021027AB9|nr:TonB-dependent receptor plug domain-containing protein [Olivibacter sp. SDN3]
MEKINYSTSLRQGMMSILLLCWCVILAHGQQTHDLSGQVTDTKGAPLPGASVTVKGSPQAISTNNEGRFSLKLSTIPATLVVTFTGFERKEVHVTEQKTLTIPLVELAADLDEVVVVGYGTQKKVNLTGSVSSVSAAEIEDRPITQASQALAGLATGVSVSQSAGRPGNDGAAIRIRGQGTFSGAGNEPLVLIDGLAASMNDIDPNNIKSISVLKDAASASIYGTRRQWGHPDRDQARYQWPAPCFLQQYYRLATGDPAP